MEQPDRCRDVSPRRPIVMVAQTPPPHHGQAVMTQVLKEALDGDFELYHVRMAFSGTIAENKRLQALKILKLLGVLVRAMVLLLRHRGAVLYYPPAPGHWVPILRDWILLAACRPFAARTVFHFHARGLGAFLDRHPLLPSFPWSQPDIAIVLGPSARSDAECIGAHRIEEIPYGLDVPVREPPRDSSSDPVILFVGLHGEGKGLFDLLETARVLMDRGCSFRIRTAGEWESEAVRERFEARRAEIDLADRVETLGHLPREKLWDAYAEADIFFFPTKFAHETFGVVLIEAMAFGLPVVSSRWPGPIDVVRDGATGILCEAGDIQAYADALQELVERPDRRAVLGAEGKILYKERYTGQQYHMRVKEFFAEHCGSSASHPHG
jgi:glycosyltransferase involved in cell wall biosynthesis